MNEVPDWIIYLGYVLSTVVAAAVGAWGGKSKKKGGSPGGTPVATGHGSDIEIVGGALADRHSVMALAGSIEAQASAVVDQTVELSKAVKSIQHSSVAVETLSMRLLELTRSVEDLKREIYEQARNR